MTGKNIIIIVMRMCSGGTALRRNQDNTSKGNWNVMLQNDVICLYSDKIYKNFTKIS